MTSRIRTEDAGWDNADIPLRTLQRAGLVTQDRQGDVRLRTSGWQALILLAELASRQEVLPEDEQTVENVWEVVREAHLNRQAVADSSAWIVGQMTGQGPWPKAHAEATRTSTGSEAITRCGRVIKDPQPAGAFGRCFACQRIVGES